METFKNISEQKFLWNSRRDKIYKVIKIEITRSYINEEIEKRNEE
jgi:hypothetical protein